MPMISTIACDSKLYTKGRVFKGCLGTCLMLDRQDSLNKAYDDFISDLFSKHGVEMSRSIYKSYDLRNKLQLSNISDFVRTLEEFYKSLLDSVQLHVVIFYTTFNTGILPTVTYYGRSRTPQKDVKTLDFIDNLSQYYDYVCSWKVSKVLQLRRCNILLDAFQGEITNSWNELTHHNNVKIIMKGDQCNRLLASADIVTRFIDEKLASKRLKLVNVDIEEAIKEYGMEKVKIYYVGQSDVVNIVPSEKRAIPLHDYLKRPSVFLLPEGIIEKESTWFEKSIVYDKVLNFASSIEGGFKRVETEQDYKYLLQPGNYVIYQGENGQKKAEYLRNVLDYPVNIISLKEIQSENYI
jgi:hypothetical protein